MKKMAILLIALTLVNVVFLSGCNEPKMERGIIVTLIQTKGYISVQKIQDGEINDYTDTQITFMDEIGKNVGNGTYFDADGSGGVSGGDLITPPAGLTSGQKYTIIMTYNDNVVGTCKFTAQ